MRMPWGKYKGEKVDELPSSYLEWMMEEVEDEELSSEAEQEWEWREQWGKHHQYEEVGDRVALEEGERRTRAVKPKASLMPGGRGSDE